MSTNPGSIHAAGNAVCTEQFVDGAQAIDEGAGMSTPVARANAPQEPVTAAKQSKYAQECVEVAIAVSSGELSNHNSRHGGGCADLP